MRIDESNKYFATVQGNSLSIIIQSSCLHHHQLPSPPPPINCTGVQPSNNMSRPPLYRNLQRGGGAGATSRLPEPQGAITFTATDEHAAAMTETGSYVIKAFPDYRRRKNEIHQIYLR